MKLASSSIRWWSCRGQVANRLSLAAQLSCKAFKVGQFPLCRQRVHLPWSSPHGLWAHHMDTNTPRQSREIYRHL